MKKVTNVLIRLLLSLILSFSVVSGSIYIIRLSDPKSDIRLIDLLVEYSVTAWLLLFLCAGIIFVALAKVPVFAAAGEEPDESKRRKDEQSD